jgi:hypothetical protein
MAFPIKILPNPNIQFYQIYSSYPTIPNILIF